MTLYWKISVGDVDRSYTIVYSPNFLQVAAQHVGGHMGVIYQECY